MTERNPLVTIAIPAFKGNYLGQAIESVLKQTYQNIELVIVNDRSPEDIDSIVAGFKDERIRYYTNAHNLGGVSPADNWNQCLSLARGEYFSLLCDDDLYAPEFVETMLGLAERFPQTNVFRARADFIDGNGCTTDWYPSSPEWESMEDYIWHVFKRCRKQTISEFMFRTRRMKECAGYASLPLAWHSDYLSVFRFSEEGGIASTYEILMHFRLSGLNISSRDSENTLEKIKATKQYIDEVKRLIEHFPEKRKNAILFLMNGYLKVDTRYMLNHAHRSTILKIAADMKTYGIGKIVTRTQLWRSFWRKRKR